MNNKDRNQRLRFCQSELFKRLIMKSPIVLVDVGARGGIHEKWNVFGEGAIKVIGFEPEPEECKRLNEVSEGNHIYFPVALSNKKREITINLTRNLACSSIFEPNYALIDRFFASEDYGITNLVQVRGDTLDEVVKTNSVKDIDFIKLDTQGSELQILQGAEKALSEFCVFGIDVEAEFSPLYKGQPLFADVDTYLRRQGFTLFDLQIPFGMKIRKKIQNPNRYSKGQVLWTHAVYFRDFVSEENTCLSKFSLSKEKAIKSIAIAELYSFNDFALELLDFYNSRRIIEPDVYKNIKAMLVKNIPSAEYRLLKNIRSAIGEYLRERILLK